MDGLGEYTYPSKRTYFGYFKNNIKSGFGILFKYQERKAFIGFWEKNKQNGLGQFINENKVILGIWQDGKLINKITSKNEFFNKMTSNEKIYLNNFRANNYSEFHKRITKLLSI